MTKTRSTFLALVAILMSPMAANADPIVAGNGDISGLNVGGTVYDVVWNFGNSNPVAADFALFTGNQAFASTFMSAVLAAFNNAGYTGVAGQRYYGVDYANVTGVFLDNVGGAFSTVNSGHGAWGSFADAGWGSVSVSVPEPGTLFLLGLGLAGLGLTSRRQKA